MNPIRRVGPWLPLTVALWASSAAPWAAPSLPEMVQAAEARNPGGELAGAENTLAGALRRKAGQPFAAAPSANLKYHTDSIGDGPGYREWEGGVEMPLWLPGQADRYTQEADRTQAVSDALRDARRLQIAGEVRERLWTAAIARGEARQAESAAQAAHELMTDVERRVAAGELPRSDRLLAQKELLQREEALQAAAMRAEQAARLFTRYTGFEAPGTPAAEVRAPSASIDPAHPRLRLARGRVDQARAHRDRVDSEGRGGPSLWLGGKSTRDATDSGYDASVGIELSLPFGTAGHTAPALAEAEAALTAAEVEHGAARLALEDDLTQAGLELERAGAALTQTERRRALSEESLALSRRAFALGETDLVRLLQAQADALAARHDAEIRQLAFGQAVARLNQALGVIPQ